MTMENLGQGHNKIYRVSYWHGREHTNDSILLEAADRNSLRAQLSKLHIRHIVSILDITSQPTPVPVDVEVKQPLSMIVVVRMQTGHWHELCELAKEQKIGPSTLARIWIIEQLNANRKEE